MRRLALLICLCLLPGCSPAVEHSPQQIEAAQSIELDYVKTSFAKLRQQADDPTSLVPKPNSQLAPVFTQNLDALVGNVEGYLNKYGHPKETLQQLLDGLREVQKLNPRTQTAEVKAKLDALVRIAEDKLLGGRVPTAVK